jgi:hypothetical protein
MRHFVNQPALRGVLHPRAGQRNQLPAEEQPEVPMPQRRKRLPQHQLAQDKPPRLPRDLFRHTGNFVGRFASVQRHGAST